MRFVDLRGIERMELEEVYRREFLGEIYAELRRSMVSLMKAAKEDAEENGEKEVVAPTLEDVLDNAFDEDDTPLAFDVLIDGIDSYGWDLVKRADLTTSNKSAKRWRPRVKKLREVKP